MQSAKYAQVSAVCNDLESLSYLGTNIWEMLPLDFKQTKSLPKLKGKIKKWNPQNCPCRLCKTSLQNIGFKLKA